MKQESVTATIDWLAYTLHWNQSALQNFRKGYDLATLASIVTGCYFGWVPQKPRNGYPYVISSAGLTGLFVMASEPDSPMGVHVSWAGSALRTIEPRGVLHDALAAGATVRRIDLAVDIPEGMPGEGFYDRLVAGSAVTSSRTYQLINSNSGWTVYVGSRTSEKFLRIYDKQAESGLDEPLTRVELECKGDYAEGIAQYVDQEGYDNFPAIIKGFCDFPDHYSWAKHMASPTLSAGIPKKEKTSDTKRWLMESVAPSLAKIVAQDHDFYVSFLLKVMTIAGVGEVQQPPDPFDGAADWTPRKR
uniref:Replication initiation protein-like C-terminal domain-containing protein n=1 Tax=uncultured prokaryote TaxID=198431 RepID=A0A0H5Q2G8_9ZZZZ|nr:hypothetical protein [uncultured prokaryote]